VKRKFLEFENKDNLNDKILSGMGNLMKAGFTGIGALASGIGAIFGIKSEKKE
jgi:hypothetical protein